MHKRLASIKTLHQTSAGICPRCGKENKCAMTAGRPAHTCWCMQRAPSLATGAAIAPGQQCWCAKCLQEMAKMPHTSSY